MSSQQPIGVCVVVLDKTKRKILLGLRKNVYGDGQWGMPGGRISLKEPIEQTVKREMLEETNLHISKTRFIGVVREFQGPHDFITFGFVSEEHTRELKNLEPEKCEEFKWIDLSELPMDMLKSHRALLDMYKNKSIGLKDLT